MTMPFKTSVDPDTPLGDHLLVEMPAPIVFNPWKHHAGFLREQIAAAVTRRQEGLKKLARQLIVTGGELMDLYLGAHKPAAIAGQVLDQLRAVGRLELPAYREWITAAGGYTELTLDDESRWVLRLGPEGERYVHIHPSRWAPKTRRVRANTLKTAVMLLAWTAVHGGEPTALKVVNQVRQDYLELSPVGIVAKDQGLHALLEDLRGST